MASVTLSPVAILCLAILFNGERTGYEIKKESLEGRHRWFVDASYGSIYPALARLALNEHVTVREEFQSGRPSRKVYAITAAGRHALIAALSSAAGPDVYRSRFLLVASFASQLPRHVVAEAVAARKQHLRQELDAIREAASAVECGAPDGSEALEWAASYGQNCIGAHLEYLEANGDRLIAMARSDLADAAE